jgi:hypothetical protein
MYKIYYSKTVGFLRDDIIPQHHIDSIEDAVEITHEEYDSVFDEHMNGKDIIADEDGRPIAVGRITPDHVLASSIRDKRDSMLRDSDWVMLSDSPVSEEDKQAWMSYRQALRNITEQEEFPGVVVFPTAPK